MMRDLRLSLAGVGVIAAVFVGFAFTAAPAKAGDWCCLKHKTYVLVADAPTERAATVVEDEPQVVRVVRRVRRVAAPAEEPETREATASPQTRAAAPAKTLPKATPPAKELPKAVPPAKEQPRAIAPSKQAPRAAATPQTRAAAQAPATRGEVEEVVEEEEAPTRTVRTVRTVRAVAAEPVVLVRAKKLCLPHGKVYVLVND